MIKAQALKKELIRLAIVAAVAVSVSGAVAYGIYTWSSGLQAEAQSAKNKLNQAQGDVRGREEKNREATEFLELYRKITGDSETEKISELNREKAENWIQQTALEYNIIKLEGAVDPIAPIENPEFRKKTFEGITSKITLKFSAMTDEQIFQFMNALLTRFPGYIKMTRVDLTRQGEITDATLVAAGRGQFPDLVTGEMEFHWIGVREVPEGSGQRAENGRQ